MNRRIVWQDVSYESAVPSLTTKRVDMAFSMLDEPVAKDKLDYIDYLTSGIQAYTLKSHANVPSLLDLCGKRVSANRRNGFAALMREWSAKNCLAAGRPGMIVRDSEGTQMARLDLKQGRVDAVVQSSESVPYTFSIEPDTYVKIDHALPSAFIAIAFPKDSTELRLKVSNAMRQAVEDGTYAKILTQFNLNSNSASDEIISRQ